MPTGKRLLVVLDQQAITYGDLMRGVQEGLLARPHWRAHFCYLDSAAGSGCTLVRQTLRRFRPHGVLSHLVDARAAAMRFGRAAVVNTEDNVRSPHPTVALDQAGMGRLAAEHLAAQGVRHFAYAAVAGRGVCALRRWQGFRGQVRALRAEAHLFDDFCHGRDIATLSDDTLEDWVRQLPKPVGLHTVYVQLAVRIHWACQELGLRVPEDVAIVGGQDFPALSTSWIPPVSAIEVDRARVAREGLELLERLMAGGRAPRAPRLIPPQGIVTRESSDRRGCQDPEVMRLRRLIHERAHEPMAVKNLVTASALSRRTLERRFARHAGHSLRAEIVLARMERARRLLRQTSLPVAQVAQQCGYASYVAFAIAFRRHAGMPARVYRARGAA